MCTATTWNHVEVAWRPCEQWRGVMRECVRPVLHDHNLHPQAHPCPVWNSGDSLFAEGKCPSIISNAKQAEQDPYYCARPPACDELDPGYSTEWKKSLTIGASYRCFSPLCRCLEACCHARNNLTRKDWATNKQKFMATSYPRKKWKRPPKEKILAEKSPIIITKWDKNKRTRAHSELNQAPLDLQSNALPLSYTPIDE